MIAACFAIAVTGCSKSPEAANPSAASTRTAPTPPVTNSAKPVPASGDARAEDVRRDIETALESNAGGVFPKGVKLNSAEVKAGVLSLDFNAAFNQVANLGESGESDVQKELMQIAAGHSAVEKMRVTVNGKSFDSQATDWNTPFSVRPSGNRETAADSAKAGR